MGLMSNSTPKAGVTRQYMSTCTWSNSRLLLFRRGLILRWPVLVLLSAWRWILRVGGQCFLPLLLFGSFRFRFGRLAGGFRQLFGGRKCTGEASMKRARTRKRGSMADE